MRLHKIDEFLRGMDAELSVYAQCMRLYGMARYHELPLYTRAVSTLGQQHEDLPLSWSEAAFLGNFLARKSPRSPDGNRLDSFSAMQGSQLGGCPDALGAQTVHDRRRHGQGEYRGQDARCLLELRRNKKTARTHRDEEEHCGKKERRRRHYRRQLKYFEQIKSHPCQQESHERKRERKQGQGDPGRERLR